MLRDYYQLTKPGIIGGNLISALGGFFLAAQGHFSILVLIAVIIGVSLIVASGCVVNNYYDRDIDALMPRTQNRLLVHTEHTLGFIAGYAGILGVAGFVILWWLANALTAFLGLLGFIIYVGAYTVWLKRRTPISTLVGSISGALPPVMGYCAITDRLDLCAWLLFLLFCLWQMPHHYAIGIFRLRDYQAAKIPVLPAIIGKEKTFFQIKLYIAAFWVTSSLFYFLGFVGLWYLLATTVINAWWLSTAIRFSDNEATKAKKIFFQSIAVICVHSFMMGFNSLPQ